MGGGDTDTTTSSTAPSDPKVTSTLDQLLSGLQKAYKAGPTYQGPGGTTKDAWSDALDAASNPAYSSDVGSAISDAGGLLKNNGLTSGQSKTIGGLNDLVGTYGALGKNQGLNSNLQGTLDSTDSLASLYKKLALNPASTQAGKNLIDSVTTGTNSSFNNSGLFGSDNDQTALSLGLTQGLGNLQQGYLSGEAGALGQAGSLGEFGSGNQFSAAAGKGSTLGNIFNAQETGLGNENTASAALPGLYNASELPAATEQAIGSAKDAASQAKADQNLTLMGQLSQILNGSAATGGNTTTTSTPSTPWWQSALALALKAA
jgi:hypothetical protein